MGDGWHRPLEFAHWITDRSAALIWLVLLLPSNYQHRLLGKRLHTYELVRITGSQFHKPGPGCLSWAVVVGDSKGRDRIWQTRVTLHQLVKRCLDGSSH